MANLTLRTSPLTLAEALHLLRRATLQPSLASAQALVGLTPAQAVTELMKPVPAPQPPSWYNDPPRYTNIQDVSRRWQELKFWYVQRIVSTPGIEARMVGFWHNIFTSDYITVYFSQFMYLQNKTIRENIWDYAKLAEEMVSDPAMLIYLNGNASIKGNPNENFAREWFELFSLGVGNYTEEDIVEAAKAFTGWNIVELASQYNPQLSDPSEKTILGKTGNWDYKDVIRITLENPACALFIAKKICKEFVESAPSDELLAAIAQLIASNKFNLKPVFEALFASEEFYDVQRRGALIKSPADLFIGLLSTFGLTNIHPDYVTNYLYRLNMEPFYPPTVEGWKGHHAWINSSTFAQRQQIGYYAVQGKTIEAQGFVNLQGAPVLFDAAVWLRTLPNSNNPREVVNNVAQLLLPIETTQQQKDVLLEILLAGSPDYEWSNEAQSTAQRVTFLLQAIVRMPEFQLN